MEGVVRFKEDLVNFFIINCFFRKQELGQTFLI